MAGLRELRKRLKSVQTTGQLAGAMRTVASAKYARAGAALSAYQAYAAACLDMQRLAGDSALFEAVEPLPDARRCFVLFGGNRGLCGGFHAELFSYFSTLCARERVKPLIVTCGRMAASFCREKGMEPARAFSFSDIPSFEEAKTLSDYVRELYGSGAALSIEFVYQRFKNTLVQIPTCACLLPLPKDEDEEEEDDAQEALLLPDRESVVKRLTDIGLDTSVYAIALENAAGAQAATLMAMRSAYDNAEKSALELETTINRRRQAEVTAGVIETASENA